MASRTLKTTTASRSRTPKVTTAVKDKRVVHKASPNKATPPKFPPRTLAKTGNAADGALFPKRYLKENVSSGKKK